MKAPKRRPSRAALKRKYDAMAREIVFRRDRNRCRRCGKQPPQVQLQWAHIYSRRYLSVRWSSLNALTLCVSCHFWIHDHPLDGSDFVRSELGNQVEVLRRSLDENRKPDLEAIGLRLQQELTGL